MTLFDTVSFTGHAVFYVSLVLGANFPPPLSRLSSFLSKPPNMHAVAVINVGHYQPLLSYFFFSFFLYSCPVRHETSDPLQRLAPPLGRVAELGLSADSTVSNADAAPTATPARVAGTGLGRPQRSHHWKGRRQGRHAGG